MINNVVQTKMIHTNCLAPGMFGTDGLFKSQIKISELAAPLANKFVCNGFISKAPTVPVCFSNLITASFDLFDVILSKSYKYIELFSHPPIIILFVKSFHNNLLNLKEISLNNHYFEFHLVLP